MMIELIIFAVILVSLQTLSTLVVCKIVSDKMVNKMMDKEFLKKYVKTTLQASEEVSKEMEA